MSKELFMYEMKAVRDFMRRQLVTLDTDTCVLDGIGNLLRHNISGAPVVDAGGKFLGVFSEKCCMNSLTTVLELGCESGMFVPRVQTFMASELVTLSPEIDVFDAIDHLLEKRISGAPVINEEGEYQGVFSEKTAMQALIAAVYDQFPGTSVSQYMDLDRNRLVSEDDLLLDVAHRFQKTPYRRFPVLRGNRLVGQVSRRDVLRAEQRMALDVRDRFRNRNAGATESRAAVITRTVGDYMDCDALTTCMGADLLSVAQMFLNSPYRRLPILEDGKLVGQISRRDVLESAAAMLRPAATRYTSETLYLSPIHKSVPDSLR
jgi:CBS domain-containing protein